MKTVHVLMNCYWGDGMSGGDRRSIEIVRRWEQCNYIIAVYTTSKFKNKMIDEGITYPSYVVTDNKCKENEKIIFAYKKRTESCLASLKNNVKDGDIIYSTTDILPDVYPGYKIKKKMGDKIRWSLVCHHLYETFYKRPGNIITNFISCSQQKLAISYGKKADAFLTVSPIVLNRLAQKKEYRDLLRPVSNAVDINLIDNSNLDISGYDAVFLARLNYSKGIFELPEIWSRVIKKYPEARLGVIGKGSEEIIYKFTEKIKECDVENNIDVLGYLDSDRAYSILKKSKVFLFTSHEEGWGIAIAEAMSCGLPVVAYDLPVFPLVFKEGIKLCQLKNADEMADAVCEYLSDDEKRIAEGERARKFILDNYSLDRVAKKELEYIIGK